MKPSLEQIAREHGSMIKRIAASYESDDFLVEELVQETLLAVWKALPSFRGEASIRTFVARIATNRAITHVKQAVKRGSSVPLSEDLPATGNGPEADVIALDEGLRLLEAVRTLPLGYRQVALLTLEGLSAEEVAGALGISVNAVAVRMSRAKDLLRVQMRG
jgi:RNA polymerase sigma factor (sigma-70 family)